MRIDFFRTFFGKICKNAKNVYIFAPDFEFAAKTGQRILTILPEI